MKYVLAICLQFLFISGLYAQIVTTDIDNFWAAYDRIVTTADKTEQLDYLNKLFIEKGTPGQAAMIRARHYTPEEYLEAINSRPQYWPAIRPNTLKAGALGGELEAGVEKLRKIYPALKPAAIYFTVGVFRSGGTTSGRNILIGSEIVFADEKMMNSLVFTNVHEYVHTQQKTNEADSLLGQSVLEGVAEFVTVKALGMPSFAPAVEYGRHHEPRVKNSFAAQMLNPYYSYWLYSDAKNEFNTRDLGYYVGYAIAEKYYDRAKDKKIAIGEMINLDYNDPAALAEYVDQSGYFPASVKKLSAAYQKTRPQVTGLEPIKNGDQKVDPKISRLTLRFSEEMNQTFRNFKFGLLGQDHSLRIKTFHGFAADGKSFDIEIEPLRPGQRYQLIIGDGFRNKAGTALKPYTIDFKTADR